MMKQTIGLGVLLAAAVSAMHLLSGSPAAIEPAAASAVQARHPEKRPHPTPVAAPTPQQGGCTAFTREDAKAPAVTYPRDPNRGSALSLLHTFLPAADTSLQAQPELRYAIALVPDPRHTNLSLLFDRSMVAIQEAAQDEGYTYNSSWLPWTSASEPYKGLADQQHADDVTDARESCPGLLLFRRSTSPTVTDAYAEGLVVLVVGEQPTGGLNQDQWDNAVAWLRLNASTTPPQTLPTRTLPILGPSFSGSLVSLDRALTNLPTTTGFPSAATPIHILSGAVSSCSSTLWFQGRLRAAHPLAGFGSFQENDELQIYRLLNYLDHQGTHPSDVAILSEDETAYAYTYAPSATDTATSTSSPCTFPYARDNRPISLSYPRDISAVRSAYEKQSVFTTTSGRSAHPILQESPAAESEPPAASDTIPAFAGPLSPIAQEAILYGIVSYLRAHHTRYLLLRCTNPLDFLFLTRFFHRAYPDGRVVTVGADLLFRREIDTTEFRGVLALSNTPLIPRNQHWSWLSSDPTGTHPQPHTHRTPDSQGEDIYLAARYLFDRSQPWPQAPKSQQPPQAAPVRQCPQDVPPPLSLPYKESLPDFGDPFWMHTPTEPLDHIQTPTWLASIGRDGYWPLAVLNDRSTPDQQLIPADHPPRCLPHTMVTLDKAVPTSKIGYDTASGASTAFAKSLLFFPPVPWWVLLACASILLIYQTLGVTTCGRYTATGLFAPFRRATTVSHLLVLGMNSGLAIVLFTGLFAIGAALTRLTPLAHSWFLDLPFLAVVVLVTLPLFCFMWIRFPPLASLTLAAVAVLLNLVLYLLVRGTLIQGSDNGAFANDIPLFYRIGHVTEGVSPLVPVMFLLAGFYLWTWQALAGNSLLCDGHPLLPCLEPDPESPPATWHLTPDSWLGLLPDVCNTAAVHLDRSYALIGNFIATRILRVASPISFPLPVFAPPALLFVAGVVYMRLKDPLLLTLEGSVFTWAINLTLLFAFCLTLAEAARLYLTWVELRRLLTALKRLRLRRTFARLRAVDSDSLWSVSGNVQRIQFLFFSQQLDAARHLQLMVTDAVINDTVSYGQQFSASCAQKIKTGPLWNDDVADPVDLRNPSEHSGPVQIRRLFNDATAKILKECLIPHWNTETSSLSIETSPEKSTTEDERLPFNMELCKAPMVAAAEEFVCFHYIAFIQVILARMKTMILSMIYLFVAVCFAISFYPFVPRTGIGIWMLIHLLLIASSVIVVYAGMERDETLSYITNTTPGKLNSEFYIKTASFLAGPVIGLLTTQFPAIAETLGSWLQPGLDVLK